MIETHTASAQGRRHRQCIINGKHSPNWGDPLITRDDEEQLTIGCININGIGIYANSVKEKSIQEFISEYNVAALGISEVGVKWNKVSSKNTIWERTLGWFRNFRISVGYNKNDTISSRAQPGGTMLLTQGLLALRSIGSGSDKRELGRWTWTVFRGKHNTITRIVSIYVPTNPSTPGESKVYFQHLRMLQSQQVQEDPIKNFWKELWEEIDKWRSNGEQLIIMGDWNNDVSDKTFKELFRQRDLVPAVTSQHEFMSPPATHNRGKKAIDEIFISSSIKVNRAGFLGHGALPTDHRLAWIQIPTEAIFGAKAKGVRDFC